jgi:threonine dehydrogenase-like Zn-dependent dehydrogenase
MEGGQAEYVRVPLADMTLAPIPEALTDEDVVLTTERLDPAGIISHTMPLGDAVEAYRMFDAREATKIILKP